MVNRAPWIIAGVAAMLATGVAGGLARLGWQVPSWGAVHHGFLMASVGFGSLITLERAVAIAQLGTRPSRVGPLTFPLASLLSGVLVLADFRSAAAVGALAAALWLLIISARLYWRHRRPEFLLMGLGALSWCAATCQWWNRGWGREWIGWMCFLLLTVTGERLDLSRFLRPSALKSTLFAVITLLLVVSASGSLWGCRPCDALLGLSVVMLAGWLFFYDAARFTLHRGGQASTSARSLLGGYAWLLISGLIMAWHGIPDSGWVRDAVMHSFFLGFVLMMVFAHGPIILPALTPFKLRHHRRLEWPPLVMSLGLALRVAGDLGNVEWMRRWGGAGSAAALMVFALIAISLVERGGAPRT
ncbi:MAG: hypothetical protein AB7F75_12905 [Planctomycetota bacterium]